MGFGRHRHPIICCSSCHGRRKAMGSFPKSLHVGLSEIAIKSFLRLSDSLEPKTALGTLDVPRSMSLPRAFLKHLDGERCDKATLKSTLGLSWRVKVCVDKEGVWFQDGWFDFVEEHDVKVGECLVFRYEGDMAFFVTIFDTSACEKRLPFVKKDNKDHGKRRHMEGEKKDDKDNRKRRCMKDEKKRCLIMKKDKDPGEQRGDIFQSSNAPAVEKLLPHKAKNPYFEATIIRSNLHDTSYMNIPIDFRKANDMSKIHKMTLTDPKGRSWPVKLCHNARGDTFFSTGWSELRKSNGLQFGDVCIFELTDTKMSTMNVHIIKRPAE